MPAVNPLLASAQARASVLSVTQASPRPSARALVASLYCSYLSSSSSGWFLVSQVSAVVPLTTMIFLPDSCDASLTRAESGETTPSATFM